MVALVCGITIGCIVKYVFSDMLFALVCGVLAFTMTMVGKSVLTHVIEEEDVCSVCGAEMEEDELYCSQCGTYRYR